MDGGSGIGIGTLLTIVFVVLKLTGVITWSWIWVLSPLWIGFAISLILFIVGLLVFGVAAKAINRRR